MAASLRASVTASADATGNAIGAANTGKTQYGYTPSPVGDSGSSADLHATTLILAILIELAAFAALRYYFRDVLGG